MAGKGVHVLKKKKILGADEKAIYFINSLSELWSH